jgi:hypothetical protein
LTRKGIAEALLEYQPPPVIGHTPDGKDFNGWEISAGSKELYRQSPNAFLMAAILSK